VILGQLDNEREGGPPVRKLTGARRAVSVVSVVAVLLGSSMTAGLEATDLRKGAKIETEDDVAELLLAAEKILDY
jgi:hypothetical protein